MDPLYQWAKRNSSYESTLTYDRRFLYSRDGFRPEIEFRHEEIENLYADGDLISFFNANKKNLYIPAHETVVVDRAHPFYGVPRHVDGNADLKLLNIIFGFKLGTKMVIPAGVSGTGMSSFIAENLIDIDPPHTLIIGVGSMLNELSLHFAYLLSKLYSNITLLQPAISQQRYLICMGFAGFGTISREDLAKISTQHRVEPVTGIFASIPQAFITWFTNINNIHAGICTEILVHMLESKEAFDRGLSYWSGISYDIKRVINLLNGAPIIPQIIKPKGIKFSEEYDEKVSFGLHLFGEPADFTGEKLHTILGPTDVRMKYFPFKSGQVGGFHWGQRKLLLSEIDFFTQNLNPNERAVAFYIGAAPFEHGGILSSFFPNVRFWLCDTRDTWSSNIQPAIDDGRIITTQVAFGTELAMLIARLFDGESALSDIVEFLKDKNSSPELGVERLSFFIEGVTKFFFISDIRSTDSNTLGHIQHEYNVHEDMKLQLKSAEIISKGMPAQITFRSSLKFRLPFIPEIGGLDYEYGSGDLHVQPWGPVDTTELRLWWDPKDGRKTYNKIEIEEIMMYHNYTLRSVKYGNTQYPGYCQCHDCHYEVYLLTAYISKFRVGVAKGVAYQNAIATIDGSFGSSLEKKSTRGQSDEKYFVTLYEKMGSKVLKYDPNREIDRLKLYFEIRADFVKLLKKEVNLSEEILDQIVNEFIVYRIYTRKNLTGDAQIFKFEDLRSDSMALAEIIKAHGIVIANPQTLQTMLDAMNGNMQAGYKRMIGGWRDRRETPRIEISKVGGKSNFHISAILGPDKKNSTIGFHKDILRRFLIGSEKNYELTDGELRKESEVLTRAYGILKRYGTIWMNHFALSLEPLYEKNPDLPGILTGGTILSANNDKYAAMYPDLELGYTENVSWFLLEPKNRIVPSKIVTCFYPNITPLWTEVIKLWHDILKSGVNRTLTVVFMIPEHLSPLAVTGMDDFNPTVVEYHGEFLNTMRNEHVKPEVPHSVVILSNVAQMNVTL